MSTPADHVDINRDHWNERAHEWVTGGERLWSLAEPVWGMWEIADSDLRMLPDDMTGLDAIELGCGSGYISAWMARRGAAVVGVDVSENQLATARRLAGEHGLDIDFRHGDAERVAFPDGSFDFAISEYGAALWCDPVVWVPEAHRLLRPGGTLVTLSTSTIAAMCMPLDGSIPCTERLERDYFSIGRMDWRDAVDEPGGIEFNRPISAWFRLFSETGFALEDFREVQAPTPGSEVNFFVTAEWAHRYPSEQVWTLRKR